MDASDHISGHGRPASVGGLIVLVVASCMLPMTNQGRLREQPSTLPEDDQTSNDESTQTTSSQTDSDSLEGFPPISEDVWTAGTGRAAQTAEAQCSGGSSQALAAESRLMDDRSESVPGAMSLDGVDAGLRFWVFSCYPHAPPRTI